MSDTQGGTVLDYLREQFARVNGKLDLMAGDIGNLKIRMSVIEAEVGHLRVGQAEINGRLDRVDSRLDRIERRLDLADAPA